MNSAWTSSHDSCIAICFLPTVPRSSSVRLTSLNILLTMLGGLDKDILDAYYGLFGETVKPVEQLALKYRVTQDALREIISKDLHRLSISPEWQMMMRRMKPIVQRKIGFAI